MVPSGLDPVGPEPRLATRSRRFGGAQGRRAGLFVAFCVAGALLSAARADAFIYWSGFNSLGHDSISRANLDGSGVDQAFICDVSSSQLAVDRAHIYFDNGNVGRANLDGSGINRNFIGGQLSRGVAVDGSHVYWGNDYLTNAIGRANLDGSGVNLSFISSPSTGAGFLAVDGAHIYWSASNSIASNSIGRANLDGSGVNDGFITGANSVAGVAVGSGHIYWTNSATNSIGRANLDSNGNLVSGSVDQNFITETTNPNGIAVDGAHVYWANAGSNSHSIGWANLDGTGVNESFITSATNTFGGVAVDSGTGSVASTRVCGAQAPTVTAINPSSGSPSGGTVVTITGTAFGRFQATQRSPSVIPQRQALAARHRPLAQLQHRLARQAPQSRSVPLPMDLFGAGAVVYLCSRVTGADPRRSIRGASIPPSRKAVQLSRRAVSR